jgi:DNA polymerase III subunit epsilon
MIEHVVGLDVETANSGRGSICQIGLSCIALSTGDELWSWESTVDPEEGFDQVNIGVHGLSSAVVSGSRKFPEIVDAILPSLFNSVIVSHSWFDFDAIHQAADKYDCPLPEFAWIDSLHVSRQLWPKNESHKLTDLCQMFGHVYAAHDALADARAVAQLFRHALSASNTSVSGWLAQMLQPEKRQYRPASVRFGEKITLEGKSDGPLTGQTVVFTGTLSITRMEAARLAAAAGCSVRDSVTKMTTVLVVGNRDGEPISSTKVDDAMYKVSRGQEVRVIDEGQFFDWISQ